MSALAPFLGDKWTSAGLIEQTYKYALSTARRSELGHRRRLRPRSVLRVDLTRGRTAVKAGRGDVGTRDEQQPDPGGALDHGADVTPGAGFTTPCTAIINATATPTPASFRPLGPPMFDSPKIAF